MLTVLHAVLLWVPATSSMMHSISGSVQVNLTRTWVTVSSLLLSFVFVFGNSIKSIYESVVYLFVVRPFDVGDAVLLGPAQDWCNVRILLRPFAPGNLSHPLIQCTHPCMF